MSHVTWLWYPDGPHCPARSCAQGALSHGVSPPAERCRRELCKHGEADCPDASPPETSCVIHTIHTPPHCHTQLCLLDALLCFHAGVASLASLHCTQRHAVVTSRWCKNCLMRVRRFKTKTAYVGVTGVSTEAASCGRAVLLFVRSLLCATGIV